VRITPNSVLMSINSQVSVGCLATQAANGGRLKTMAAEVEAAANALNVLHVSLGFPFPHAGVKAGEGAGGVGHGEDGDGGGGGGCCFMCIF